MRKRFGLFTGCLFAFAPAALAQGGPPQAWAQAIPGYADKPTVADLNGDGLLEVVAATDGGKVVALDGASGAKLWTVAFDDERFTCCPIVDDVDGSGSVELILTGGRGGLVLCLNGADGSTKWSIPAGRDGIAANAALADANGDGRKELYYPQGTDLKAVDAASGQPLWSQRAGGRLRGSVSVADIDGGEAEILVGCDSQEVLCFFANGSPKWTAKVRGPVTKAPVICDANGDGQAEIYVVGTAMARLDSRGGQAWQWAPRSGGLASGLVAEDINGDGAPELVITGYDGKLHAVSSAGRELWSFTVVAPEGGQVKYIPGSTPAMVDVNGDGAADCILTSPRPDAPKVLAINGKTGKALWSAALNAFSQGCPLVADVTGDRKAELIACAASGRLQCFKLARNGGKGWVKFGGDLACSGSWSSARAASTQILASAMPFRVSTQTVAWSNLIGGTPPSGPGPSTPTTPTGPTTPAVAGRPASSIAVLLNGNWLSLSPPPAMVGGSVLVPLRGIFEAMQAVVEYDGATKTITATRGTTTVILTLGQTTATVNGSAVRLATPAQAVNGSTFVPLRFIGEAFGATVKWDGAGRNVEITS